MAYSYILEGKAVELTKETQTILTLFTEALKKNSIDISMVSSDSVEKKGLWNGFILKLESAIGTQLGATEKMLPAISPQLDCFGHRLMDEFELFLNTLLKNEGIDGKTILQDTIDNKFVLIKELLLRLMSHALATDISVTCEGKQLVNVASCFIEKLNFSQILFNKSIIGKLQSSYFGSHLSTDIHYWLNFMSNRITVSDLIYKNKNSTISCLKIINKLKFIAINQIATFLDSNLSIEDYHPKLLPLTFNRSLHLYKLNTIKVLLDTKNKTTHEIELSISQWLEQSGIPKRNKEKLINLFCFLIDINGLERMLERISTMTSDLGWFPIISGMLDFNPVADHIAAIYEKATDILKVDLQNIPETEKNILQTYSSYHTPPGLQSYYLETKINLAKLGNEDFIKQVMTILDYSADKLDTIQHELGIYFFDKPMFDRLVLNEKAVQRKSYLPALSEPKEDKAQAVKSSLAQKPPLHPRKSASNNPFDEYVNPNTPGVEFFQNNVSLEANFAHHYKVTNCTIQFNDGTVTATSSYILTKTSEKGWGLCFYLDKNSEPHNIKIHEVPGLQEYLNAKNPKEVINVILAYHINTYSEKLFADKKYLELLNYLKDNNDIIKNYEWLSNLTELRKLQSCFEIPKENQYIQQHLPIIASMHEELGRFINTSQQPCIIF